MNRFSTSMNIKQRGFSMLALLIIIPSMILLAGTAVTVSLGLNTQHQLGLASESAAMYFAKRKAVSGQEATVAQVTGFLNQFSSVGRVTEVVVTPLTNGYRVRATSSVPILMMPDLGDSFTVTNHGAAEIEYRNSSKVDIVLMLDLSSSQTIGLQDTIDDLHRVITSIEGRYEPGNIRMGLMAFSFFPSISDADWRPQSHQGIECVSSTVYVPGLFGGLVASSPDDVVANLFTLPQNLSDIGGHTRPLDTTWLSEGCPDVGSLFPTADLSAVKQRVSSHAEESNSQITIYQHALIYAARMLDEGWSQEWKSDYVDIGERKKAVIAIGDGADGAVYVYEFRNMINAGLCDAIRDNDIELYYLHSGVDYRPNSNIENCVTTENTKPMARVDEVIDTLIGDVDPNGSTQNLTLKLIP